MLKILESGYYPTLNAFGNLNYTAQRNEFNFFDNEEPWFRAITVGVRLNVPIFDGFQRRNQVRQAKNEVEKIDRDIHQLGENTRMSLLNSQSQMKSSLSSIEAQERNVELALEVYKNIDELYQAGLSPLTEVLDAEVSLRQAQINLNNERLKYQLAQLNYLKAKGNLMVLTQ